ERPGGGAPACPLPPSPGGRGRRPGPAGTPCPADLLSPLRLSIRRPDDLGPTDVAPFISVSPEELTRRFDFSDDPSDFKWALATAQTYQRIGLDLWRREHPDVPLVYIEGTDSVAHLFGHLSRARGLAAELAAQQ